MASADGATDIELIGSARCAQGAPIADHRGLDLFPVQKRWQAVEDAHTDYAVPQTAP